MSDAAIGDGGACGVEERGAFERAALLVKEMSPLMERGIANKDDEDIARACGMGWRAAWICARMIAASRGWECETPKQASAIMMRLGGVNERDATGGDLSLFQLFCGAQGFHERAYGAPDEPRRYYPEKKWQLRECAADVRALVGRLRELDGRERVAA